MTKHPHDTLISELREALNACVVALERADTSEGVCCCGDPMKAHPFTSGHTPVDAGDYYVSKTILAARAILTKALGESE